MIDNAFYDDLGSRWYHAQDDPVALLRAEAAFRNPHAVAWVEELLGAGPLDMLDLGCGGGFLSNDLARRGHRVTGLDVSRGCLRTAAQHDVTGTVRYELGDVRAVPYGKDAFDAVFAMDLLEHVEPAEAVFAEAARILRPGGAFVFYTFNRTLLAWLVVVKGVEWFVRNTPPHMHDARLFLRPAEIRAFCRRQGLELLRLQGTRPEVSSNLLKMLRTGIVPDQVPFRFSSSLALSYLGLARRQAHASWSRYTALAARPRGVP